MNNPATPFSRTTFDTCFSLTASRSLRLRAIQGLLLIVCLHVLAANTVRAQEATETAAPAAERAAAPAAGTITGRVVSDDGRPLADAVIFLGRAFARVAGPPLTATTDSEGRFRVTGLDSGLFFVSAMMPGFTMPEPAPEAGELSYYRLGDNVNLTLVRGGVITGTVRDANGEPIVALAVRAVRVRDAQGRNAAGRFSGFVPERMTDDRGVYRIYGLPPGTYVISTGGSQRLFGNFNAYEGDAPTYFPSSTRDTAAEVPLRAGEEASNVDIRYRGERGHAISGTVSGFVETDMRYGVSITLKQVSTGSFEGATFVAPGVKTGFAFTGVSDGEYELLAQQYAGDNNSAASQPRRVTVKGADVTGLELALSPLASISGRIQLDAPPKVKCPEGRTSTLLETLVSARRDEKNKTAETSGTPFLSASGGLPTAEGEFTLRNLMPGSYRLLVRLLDEAWYVRSIALPNAPPAAQPKAPAAKAAQPRSVPGAQTVMLKSGERVTNVMVEIGQDAAGLRGRVAPSAEGAQVPANLKVYLVPAERERADDVMRYREVAPDSSGAFSLTNLAPGRYWVVARPAPDADAQGRAPRPLSWDAEERARLRREAEAANAAIELQPCQRVNDYVLPYGAAK
jgi:hypothetical protein